MNGGKRLTRIYESVQIYTAQTLKVSKVWLGSMNGGKRLTRIYESVQIYTAQTLKVSTVIGEYEWGKATHQDLWECSDLHCTDIESKHCDWLGSMNGGSDSTGFLLQTDLWESVQIYTAQTSK